MLAAENGALPGGKVGGIGDVIRDLPLALAARGWKVTVMTPSYGSFHQLPDATMMTEIDVQFAGDTHQIGVYCIEDSVESINHIVLEHALFSPQGTGQIYCDDKDANPFATDATKFAFFSAAAAACIKAKVVTPNVIHLHDWHTAMVLMLRSFDPNFECLKRTRMVYTIHNLALQGIRPLTGHASSLETWFPGLDYSHEKIVDPRYHNCVNPVALAIRLADHLNTVSPTYALEILDADDPSRGFHGGEGLELDLQTAASENRLVGILNGCTYDLPATRRPTWKLIRETIAKALGHWISQDTFVRASHFLALQNSKPMLSRKPTTLLVSIGRITSQKVGLFLQPTGTAPTALDAILQGLSPGELMVMLGNGDAHATSQITQIAQRYDNFLFLDGYIDTLPDLLYRAGDLFLMPSSFEPCGISQMLAMREGQPCVVHGVGGLKDTVEHQETGFVFAGATSEEQAEQFVSTVADALKLKASDKTHWQTLRANAQAARFDWAKSAQQYEQVLYAHDDT